MQAPHVTSMSMNEEVDSLSNIDASFVHSGLSSVQTGTPGVSNAEADRRGEARTAVAHSTDARLMEDRENGSAGTATRPTTVDMPAQADAVRRRPTTVDMPAQADAVRRRTTTVVHAGDSRCRPPKSMTMETLAQDGETTGRLAPSPDGSTEMQIHMVDASMRATMSEWMTRDEAWKMKSNDVKIWLKKRGACAQSLSTKCQVWAYAILTNGFMSL